MVSANISDTIKSKNTAEEDLDFCVLFIKKIKENGFLSQLFSELKKKSILKLLYQMGVPDALSYINKPKKRLNAYIKTKNPMLLFQKNYLLDKNVCQEILVHWLIEMVSKTSKNINLDENEEVDKELEIFMVRIISAIQYCIQNNELQKACYMFGCYVAIPFYPLKFNTDERTEFLIEMQDPGKEYLEKAVKKLQTCIEKETDIDIDIDIQIIELKEKYFRLGKILFSASQKLIEFKEIPIHSLTEDIESLKNDFQELRSHLQSIGEEKGIDPSKIKKHETLNELIQFAAEIEKHEAKNFEHKIQKARDILEDLEQIQINGSQEDEHLISFLHKIKEMKRSMPDDEENIEQLSSGIHPVSVLKKYINEQNKNKQECKSLQEALQEFCGRDTATHIVFYLIIGELSLMEVADEPPQIDSINTVDSQKEPNYPEALDEIQSDTEQEEKETSNDAICEEDVNDISQIEENPKVAENGHGVEQVSRVNFSEPDIETNNETRIELNGKKDHEIGTAGASPEIEESSQTTIDESKDKIFFKQCLAKGELRKAYWIAEACEVGISPDLVGALALGIQTSIGSSLPAHLQSFFSKIINNSYDDISSKLLLFSSIIGTALFTAPSSNEIFTLILFVECGVPPLDNLAKLIKYEFLHKGITINPGDVNSGLGFEEKEQKLRELKDSSYELIRRNCNAYFTKYVPAKTLLRHLYREGSELTRIHRIIERSKIDHGTENKSRIQEIKTILKNLDAETIVSNAHTLGLNKVFVPIQGTASNQLIRRINDSIAIGREWYSLFADFSSSSNEKLIVNLQQSIKSCIDYLDNLANEKIDTNVVEVARNSFLSILNQLDGKKNEMFTPLNHEILGIETLPLNDEFEIESNTSTEIVECFMDTPDDRSDISLARFSAFIKRKEFLRAGKVIDIFRLGQKYRDRLDHAVIEEQTLMKNIIEILKNKVEDAYLLGRLSSQEDSENTSQEVLRIKLTGTLEKAHERLVHDNEMISWRIREVEATVNEIHKQLTQIEDEQNINLLDEFNKILSQFPDSESGEEDQAYVKTAFNEAMAQNDNIAAFELINRAREALQVKIPFPRTDIGKNEELSTFLNRLGKYQDHFGNKKNIDIAISSMNTRKSFAGINFGSIDKAHQKVIVSGMSAWRDLLRINYPKAKDKLLSFLKCVTDFLELPFKKDSFLMRSNLDEDFLYITAGMNFAIDCCPIPTFGSSLGRIAHIVLSKDKKEPDQLASFLNRHELQQKPVFFLYLQEMTFKQRMVYQQFFAKKKLSVLIIDLCLSFHLCEIRYRLPVLFRIALPFSWAQPYLMKGENVPQETFVGRSEEVKTIYDPDGSCIIFGGRQLGKSALLRHIYNSYNNPEKHEYVVYLDIDELGMEPQTHEQMRVAFWKKVYKVLCRENFIQEKMIKARKADKIEHEITDEIQNALQNNPDARLYLLLDETDNFLDNDSSFNFPIIRHLRAMMASTNRRFKVVLAGLQSVQRYKNWKNHPFAQLGTDIVVRPLNPKAAQELILSPLNALGFVFEKTGLILRIVSQANYHPGLIQIFCHRLVEKLYNKWGNTVSKKIVRKISLNDLLMIERDPNFIEDIRNRFDWTLDLDDRYKVLIYSLVLTEDPTSSKSEREFMDLAYSWWPQVFEKMDQQSLRAVLDEMDGLGVLVREDEHNTRMYRLRSPNLLRLLGTREQIEDELLRITSLENPRILNPRNFHSKINENPIIFGPMTKEQEGQISNVLDNDIFGTTVITGSVALGLDCVTEQLKSIFLKMKNWEELLLPAQHMTVPEKITNFIKENFKQRNRLNQYLVVDLSFFYQEFDFSKLLLNLLKNLDRTCTKNSRGHIIFLIDPQHSWLWLGDSKRENLLQHPRVNSIELKRWSNGAITNALENIGAFGGAKDLGEDIFDLTSGWHNLMNAGLRKIGSSPSSKEKENIMDVWQEQIDIFNNHQDKKDVLGKFGLTSEEPVLANCLNSIFNWCYVKEEDSMIITQDVFDCVASEDEELAELLSDGGRKIKTWLLMNDIILNGKDESLLVNEFARDIIHLNT